MCKKHLPVHASESHVICVLEKAVSCSVTSTQADMEVLADVEERVARSTFQDVLANKLSTSEPPWMFFLSGDSVWSVGSAVLTKPPSHADSSALFIIQRLPGAEVSKRKLFLYIEMEKGWMLVIPLGLVGREVPLHPLCPTRLYSLWLAVIKLFLIPLSRQELKNETQTVTDADDWVHVGSLSLEIMVKMKSLNLCIPLWLSLSGRRARQLCFLPSFILISTFYPSAPHPQIIF